MITHEIIQQMERELKSNLEQLMLAKHETRNERIVALFHSYTRKIVESVAEEIINSLEEDVKTVIESDVVKEGNAINECISGVFGNERLKVKEIITILK